jgi:hypothetical protein
MPRGNTKRCPTCGSQKRSKNGAELLLMGANPSSAVYDQLSKSERLAFGRLGLGKAQIQTKSDLTRARKMVEETRRLKNRLPNPSAFATETASADSARQLREGFSGEASEKFVVMHEPHVPAGDYTDCGEFIAVGVVPTATGTARGVQEISFPGKDLELICDPGGRQLFIVGPGQHLTDADIRMFTDSTSELVDLGQCAVISYAMKKFGREVPASARGEDVRWDHEFGEEGGTRPSIFYDRKKRRLILGRATYRIEGSWIRD